MQYFLFLWLAALLCAQPDPCSGPNCTEVHLTVDGRDRLYQFHLPQGANCTRSQLPVVFFFHGGGGRASSVRSAIGYSVSDANCFLLAFPEAVQYSGNGYWNIGNCLDLPPGSGYTGPATQPGCGSRAYRDGVDDVKFVAAVIDSLASQPGFTIDRARIYASGHSQGAGLSQRLACELPNRIAAIGPIEGTVKVLCQPSRAVPVVEWQSLADTESPFSGGTGDASVPYTIGVWLSANGLSTFANPTRVTRQTSATVSSAADDILEWDRTTIGPRVVLHRLTAPLPHSWLYGYPDRGGPVAFDWQTINWQFFSRFRLALPVLVSSASFAAGPFAPASLVSVFGDTLATGTSVAQALPLPQTLAGVSAVLRLPNSSSAPIGLLAATPTQLNLLLPPNLAEGNYPLLIQSPDGSATFATTTLVISRFAPGLFTANGAGNGPPAATVETYQGGIRTDSQPAARFEESSRTWIPVPVTIPPPPATAILILYGTGLRDAPSLMVQIGNQTLVPLYAGPQADFPGLDQVNVALPQSLRGAGTLSISLRSGSISSNSAVVSFSP